MSLVLDPQTEQRIQRHIAVGGFPSADDLLNAALDTLATEAWSEEDKADLDQRLALSIEQAANGRVYTADEAARLLDQRIAQRAAKKAS